MFNFTDEPTEEFVFTDTPDDDTVEEPEFSDAPPTPKKRRGFADTMKDIDTTLQKGFVSLFRGGVGLLDIISKGQVGKDLASVGIKPGEVMEKLQGDYSPAQREAFENVHNAEGFVNVLKAYADNPSTIAHQVGEAIPSMIAAGYIGKSLALAKLVAPYIGAAFGEGFITMGHQAAGMREESETGNITWGQAGAAVASGTLTSAISMATGRLAKKFGFADPDAMFAGQKLDPKQVHGRVFRTIAGGLSEGAFEELPQEIQETIIYNAATGKPLTTGLDQAAAGGLATGTAMGVGANVMSPSKSTMKSAVEAHNQQVDITAKGTDKGSVDLNQNKAQVNPERTKSPGLNLDTLFDVEKSDTAFESSGSDEDIIATKRKEQIDNTLDKAKFEQQQQQQREQAAKEAEAQKAAEEQQVQTEQTQKYVDAVAKNKELEQFRRRIEDPEAALSATSKLLHQMEVAGTKTKFADIAKKAHQALSYDEQFVSSQTLDRIQYEVADLRNNTTNPLEKIVLDRLDAALGERILGIKEAESYEFTDAPKEAEPGYKPISGKSKPVSLEEIVGRPDGEVTPISGKVAKETTLEDAVGQPGGLTKTPKFEFTDFDTTKKPAKEKSGHGLEFWSQATEEWLDRHLGKKEGEEDLSSPFRRYLDGEGKRPATKEKKLYHGGGKWDTQTFDLKKIGTGEKTASFGYGAYLTEADDTATFYQKLYGGYKYQFDVPDAELDHLLDWDKPLDEQPKFIQEAFKKQPGLLGQIKTTVMSAYDPEQVKSGAVVLPESIKNNKFTGRMIYESLLKGMPGETDKEKAALASAFLNDMGIKGNKFLGGTPTGTRGTAYNYVIWDQELLDKTPYSKNEDARNLTLPKAQDLWNRVLANSSVKPFWRRDNKVAILEKQEKIWKVTGWFESEGEWKYADPKQYDKIPFDIGKDARGKGRAMFLGEHGAGVKNVEKLEQYTSGEFLYKGPSAKNTIKEQTKVTLDTGGSTYSVSGKNLAGTKNIAVSIFPDLTRTISGRITEDELTKYREKVAPTLLKNPLLSIGTWYDSSSDQTYLDVALTVPDEMRDVAVALGKKYNQKAVFDLSTFEEIDTGGTGEADVKLPGLLKRLVEVSEVLTDNKEYRDLIWKKTGWWEMFPGQWTIELNDSAAKFKPGGVEKIIKSGSWGVKLDDVFEHDPLLHAYPELKNVTVIPDNRTGAQYTHYEKTYDSPTVRIDPDILEHGYKDRSAEQILLHELQHGVQHSESFIKGGSPKSFNLASANIVYGGETNVPAPLKEVLQKKINLIPDIYRIREIASGKWFLTDKEISDIKYAFKQEEGIYKAFNSKSGDAHVEELKASSEMLSSKKAITASNLPYERYLKLGGEVQSRLVEKRLKLSDAERKSTPPWETMQKMLEDEGLIEEGQAVEDIILDPKNDMIYKAEAGKEVAEGVQKIGKFINESDKEILETINNLQSMTKRAAKAIVVADQSLIPEGVLRLEKGDRVSAAWDSKKDVVYFVTNNLKDKEAAVKAWLHEQIGHRGVTDLFKDQGLDFDMFLDAAYDTVTKSPKLFKEVSEMYNDPKLEAREQKRLIVEEVIARRSEDLNPFARKSIFQRFLDFINRWVRKVTGLSDKDVNITMKDIDTLLEAAKNRVVYGEVRDWLEFKHPHEEYKAWAKEVLVKNPQAVNWYESAKFGTPSVMKEDLTLLRLLFGLTSPSAKVTHNAVFAAQSYAFLAGKRDKPGGRYPSNVGKVLDRIKSGDQTFSKLYKVDEFVRALLGDKNATTHDMWMHYAFLGDALLTPSRVDSLVKSGRGYERDLLSLFSLPEHTAVRHELFKLASELTKETKHQWHPRDVQATIWMHVVAKNNKAKIEDFKYDYDEVFFNFKSKALADEVGSTEWITPWEYIQKVVGDRVGSIAKENKMDEIRFSEKSKLEEAYNKYREKEGIAPITPSKAVADTAPKPVEERSTTKLQKKFENLHLRNSVDGPMGHLQNFADNVFDWGKKKKEAATSGKIQEALFDDLYQVKQYSVEAWKSLRMLRGIPTMMGSMLKEGTVVWDPNTNYVTLGEADGGLLKVFEGIGAEKFEAVKARLIAERVNDLLNNSNLDQKILERIYGDDAKGNQIDPIKETADILDATKHLENDPEYAKVKAHLDKYNKAMLDILAKSGVISEQAKDDWGQFASYVPLNRVFTEEQNPDVHDSNFFASPSKISGPKKFKGSGGHPIGDPIDNLIKNYSFLLNQALRNVAYKKLYNDAYGMNVLVGEMVPPKMARFQAKQGERIIVKVKGEDRVFKVDDARLFHALADTENSGFHIPVLNIAKKWLTWGVTISPAFRIRNFLRDTFHTWILMGKINLFDVTKAFKDVLVNHNDFKRLKAMGGGMSGSFYNAENPKSIQKLVDSTRKDKDGNWNPISLWERVGEASENANRLALFRKLQLKGATEFEAGFQARDLLDFSAHGKHWLARTLTSTVPFLNARLQGLHKIGREATGPNKVKVIMRGALVAVTSLALHALNKANQPDDDKWYDKIPDHDRWAYWFFGKHIAIPKPFEVGAIFGELPVQVMEAAYKALVKEDPEALEDLWNFTAFTVWDTLRLNPLGQLNIIYEQMTNKDFFKGRPIVPTYMERLEPKLQYDHKTSKTARLIGETTGVSPMRIEHVIDKMFSYAGGAALLALDQVVKQFHEYPEDPAMTMDDLYWLHGRIPRGKQRYIKQEQEFYDLFAEVDRVSNSFKALRKIDRREAKEYRGDNRGELLIHPRMTRIKTKLAEIRAKERRIYNDPDMSSEEKREKLEALIDKRHKLILKQLEKVKEKRNRANELE